MTQNGFITAVAVVQEGSAVAAAASIGATTIFVDDAYDFDEDGGLYEAQGLVYTYTAADPELDTLTVLPLTVALDVGEPILVSPASNEKRASVVMSDSGDSIDARVPHSLYDRIPEGIRDDQESVTIELINNEWVIVDVFGKVPSIDGSYIDPATVPSPATDGFAPASSPVPVVIGGIGMILVRWNAIVNHDPVTYTLHMSTTQSFTPNSTTVLNVTPGLTTTVRTLPDNTPLAYGVDYYFRVVASDVDGDAAPSDAYSAQMFMINSPDIAANYIYAGQIIADQITGGTVSSDLTLSSTIKTADSGARVEMSPLGILITDSTGAPTTSLGTNAENFFKGNIEANGLTVLGGATFRSTTNELSRAAVWTLASGITNSTVAPNVVVDWEKVELQKVGGGATWPTPGNLKGLSYTPDGKWISADTTGGFNKWNADGSFNSSTAGITGLTHVTQPVSGGSYYGMQINGATASISRLTEENVFTDAFSGTLTGWPASAVVGSGTKAIVSGKAQLTAPTGSDGARIERTLEGSFRTRAVQMQIAATSGSPVGDGVWMEVGNSTDSTYFNMRIDGSNLIAYWSLNGSDDFVTITYSPTAHAYWRMYELNNRVNFQTSPDAVTWTTQANPNHGRPASVFTGMYWNFGVAGSATPGPNLIANAGFETNTSGWTPQGTATLTRNTVTPLLGVADAVLAKPRENTNVEMSYQSIAVTAGRGYTAYGFAKGFKASNLASYVRFDWFNSVGTSVGSNTSSTTAITDSGSTFIPGGTVTAPAGATSLVLTFGTNDASTSSFNAKTTWDDLHVYDATAATLIATGDNARYYGVASSLPIARINTTQSPALGSYVTTGDLLFAEFDNANNRFVVKRINHEDMSTVVSTFTSASNAIFSGTLAGVMRANFDFPEERYIFSVQGAAGTNWWSFKNSDGSYQAADTFPVITGGHQGMGWDGTNFWALGSDAFLYKHSTIKWVAGTDSASWQIGTTWYDGGTQETTPSPYTTITMKMRARLSVTSATIPYTGVGDPDRIRVYVGRGGGTKFRQATTAANINTATLTAATFSGTAAPTTNTFASATPAKIRNTDDSLTISADGSIKAKTLDITDNPYWYGFVTTAFTLATGTTNTLVTTWVADGSPSVAGGITFSAGVVTVPKAGRYKLTAQVSFAAVAGGRRFVQIFNGAGAVLAYGHKPGENSAVNQVYVSKTCRLAASDTFRVLINQNSGSPVDITAGAGFTFFQVEYLGP